MQCSADAQKGQKRQIPLHVLRLLNVTAGSIPLPNRSIMAVANGVYHAPEDDNSFEYFTPERSMTFRGVFQEICSMDNSEEEDDEVCIALRDVHISHRRSPIGRMTADIVLIPILNAEVISYQERTALKVG
jgi:hypothetical protein